MFFYSLAFPITIVNNLIFFINFRAGQTSIKDDMYLNIATRNDLELYYSESLRQNFMWWVNIIPLLCLSVDFCFNQISFPVHFWIINFIYSVMYLLWTYFDQIIIGRNWYYNNLNWSCKFDKSFYYNTTSNAISETQTDLVGRCVD